jgi:hypothetical protein
MRLNLSVSEIDALLQHAERSPVKCEWDRSKWSDFRRGCDKLRSSLALTPQPPAPLEPLISALVAFEGAPLRETLQQRLGVGFDELTGIIRRLEAQKIIRVSRSRGVELLYLTARGREMYDAAATP